MFTVPVRGLGGLARLVLAVGVAVPLVIVAAASLPALLILPFFPVAADRADRLVDRFTRWTALIVDGLGVGRPR